MSDDGLPTPWNRGRALKIAFCVNWGSGRHSGIFRKVAAQAAAWKSLGADVALFVTTSPDGLADWSALGQTAFATSAPARALSRLRAREAAAKAARDWQPDVVYVRHGLMYPGLLRLARALPLVIEVNGDDLAEAVRLGPAHRLVTKLSHGLGLRAASGLVFVTHELAERQSFSRYGRPAIVLANGIDLNSVPPAPPSSGSQRAIFIGHPHTPWHGTDLLLGLAARLPEWRFDLVGPDPADLPTAPVNVTAHGLLDAESYRGMLAAADLAIGSLAMHRAGITEGSPLKVREYLAAGIPTVIAYRDTDFPGGADFLLQLPADLAHADTLIPEFARRWAGRRIPRSDVALLDVAVKETARLRFLKQCAAGGRDS